MNRDPENNECTRDPIFLLQVAIPQWTQIPDGLESDGESFYVEDIEEVDEWLLPFLKENEDGEPEVESMDAVTEAATKQEGDHGLPLVYTEWRTESVFLTRPEAEKYAQARHYRWWKWRVFCVPCEGKLAQILNAHSEAGACE